MYIPIVPVLERGAAGPSPANDTFSAGCETELFMLLAPKTVERRVDYGCGLPKTVERRVIHC
jgi:hypothetical protein